MTESDRAAHAPLCTCSPDPEIGECAGHEAERERLGYDPVKALRRLAEDREELVYQERHTSELYEIYEWAEREAGRLRAGIMQLDQRLRSDGVIKEDLDAEPF